MPTNQLSTNFYICLGRFQLKLPLLTVLQDVSSLICLDPALRMVDVHLTLS